jgi:hypothetical protein
VRRLQRELSSRDFTAYRAYARRNTLQPDVWFAAFQNARCAAGDPPEKFIPIVRGDEDEERRRRAITAEESLDRAAEE